LNRSASLLAILAVFLSLGGCSRDNIAQAKPVSVPLPYPTQAEEVGQEEQVEFVPATVGFAEGKAQEEPKDIIAAQIRSQGYACNSTQSAERDAEASTANEAVWMLRCQNASYRVTLIPNLAAKVEKVGAKVRRELQKATPPADKEASQPQPPQTTNSFAAHSWSFAVALAASAPRASAPQSDMAWLKQPDALTEIREG
jgi:cell division septation protein DedD